MNRWEKFQELSGAEQRLLMKAAVLLPAVHLAMKVLGYDSTQRLLERRSAVRESRGGTIEHARRIAYLVRVAGYHGVNPVNCLRESLALWFLLRRRGYDPQLRIGVRKQQHALEAHAWVELAGEVLNDHADVGRRYAPLQEPTA